MAWERAPAVCLPLPDYILIGTFLVLEILEESRDMCKQINLSMTFLGLSPVLSSGACCPFLALEELVCLGNQMEVLMVLATLSLPRGGIGRPSLNKHIQTLHLKDE